MQQNNNGVFKKVVAPDVLCLYEEKYVEQTLIFIRDLYDYEAHSIVIDFSNTRMITAAAGIAILAHVHCIQLNKHNLGYFDFYCKQSPIYKPFFIKSSFLTCLKKGAKEDLFDVPYKCKNGRLFAENRKRTLNDIDSFQKDLKEKTFQKTNSEQYLDEIDVFFRGLRTAISEALLNIDNHAYVMKDNEYYNDGTFDIYREKLWWQALWYRKDTHEIAFLIYDLGLGIVNSYIQHATRSRHANYSCLSSLDIFKEALQEGKSRFIGDGRGHGLANVIQLAHDSVSVSLRIYSDNVGYKVESKKSEFYESQIGSLTGTLFQWVFKLPEWSITK